MRCRAFHKPTCGFIVRILLHCVKEYIAMIPKVKEEDERIERRTRGGR